MFNVNHILHLTYKLTFNVYYASDGLHHLTPFHLILENSLPHSLFLCELSFHFSNAPTTWCGRMTAKKKALILYSSQYPHLHVTLQQLQSRSEVYFPNP